MTGNNYQLFSNCVISKGFTRYLILDLQRGEIYPIDKTLGDYMLENETFDFSSFQADEREFYLSFLLDREVVFECNDIPSGLFPRIESHYESPSWVLVIEAEYSFLFELDKSLFIDLIVQHLVIHVSEDIADSWNNKKIGQFIEDTAIEFCSVVLSYNDYHKLKNQLELNSRISQILVTGSPENVREGIITFVTGKEQLFAINRPTVPVYFESLNYSLYFNGRVHFTSSEKYHFGDETVYQFTNSQELKRNLESKKSDPKFIWNMSNSKKSICKDCEYKNICTNKLDEEKQSNKDLLLNRCSFNPYISKWENEEDYYTLSECGVTSNENGLSIDHEKIATINEQLWAE